MTRKDYEKAAKLLGWERMLNGASETASAERVFTAFFENDSLVFEPYRFSERIEQWAVWLSCRTTQTDKPVYEGEYERTTVSEMNHEREKLLRAA